MSSRKPSYHSALQMIELLKTVDGGKRDWLLEDAIDRFDCDEKTIRRYVKALGDRFQDSDNEPMVRLEKRKDGTFIVATGTILSTDPTLDYASLFLATKLLDFAPETHLHKALERIGGLFKNKAKGTQKNVLSRFARKFYVHHGGMQRGADHESIGRIVAGLVEERRLSILYKNWKEPKTLEPLCLKVFREILYLDVRSPGKPGHFTLALSHIKTVQLLRGEPFDFPEDWFPAQEAGDKFGMMKGVVIEVSLLFVPLLESYVQTRMWHPSQHTTKLPDNRVRLTLKTTDTPELLAWIAGFGPQVFVESPKSLQKKVQAHLEQGREQYA